jgi:hypothetical protein
MLWLEVEYFIDIRLGHCYDSAERFDRVVGTLVLYSQPEVQLSFALRLS